MTVEGGEYSVSETSSGRVYSWGNQSYFIPRDSLHLADLFPDLATLFKNAQKIVIEGSNTLVLDYYGNVWTWGKNTNNRLGKEYELDGYDETKPEIIGHNVKAKDIGYDRDFYVIDEQGKRMNINEYDKPSICKKDIEAARKR